MLSEGKENEKKQQENSIDPIFASVSHVIYTSRMGGS